MEEKRGCGLENLFNGAETNQADFRCGARRFSKDPLFRRLIKKCAFLAAPGWLFQWCG